jgi:phosphoglucosamine mutase
VALFPQELINVRLQPGQDWQKNERLSAECEGLRQELDGSGRVLIRASGTEPVLRVMVEARDPALARRAAERLAEAVRAG